MATYTLQAPLPDIALASGMKLKLEAISPTTGAAVSGVTCSAWAIYGVDLSEQLGGVVELPAWVPAADEDEA